MSTARYLALIDDLLRTREFPAQRRRTATGFSGPGYHTAELSGAGEPGGEDAAERVEAREQCVAEHDALVAVLDGRWGEAQVFSLWSLLERSIGGEAVPAPWDELSAGFDSLHLWRADGRWIAVGLALEAEGPSYALAAVVTGIDPP
ncbi:hypothetical protein [Streptomyces chryseus]|uniref:Uncharacterized protein n=1 Tax=Streptomyces chryseus TaxID=68186 RepID=A0ABQ3DWU7_9ACTN|nr:hypothetical protein [Streptomyces chryseus]GGX17229.1 hypothetical protein GCM10010353_35550 [Streptomyces chryseus]GHB13174.1 hypothetical protein GCM10010346_40860 [Streptomyces chryseus]